jgi:hypothetical protein
MLGICMCMRAAELLLLESSSYETEITIDKLDRYKLLGVD